MSSSQTSRLSRRDFLKKVGAGAAVVVAARLFPGDPLPAAAYSDEDVDPWGMLIDLTRCTGCSSCALACKAANGLPDADQVPEGLASQAYTFVSAHQVTTSDGEPLVRYAKRQCMHCLEPACVSACPAAAMYKSDDGPVVYRPERCLGCRYCQLACPFGIPRFQWDDGVSPVISKCWMCYGRLLEGQKPACAEACPTGALRFGKRSELLAQAHAQIVSNPNRYIDHVYGEFEVGGTAMLYLSDVPFEDLDFPGDLPATAPPQETEKIMSKLPYVIGAVTAVMMGTALYTHRATVQERQLVKVSQEPSTGSQEDGP